MSMGFVKKFQHNATSTAKWYKRWISSLVLVLLTGAKTERDQNNTNNIRRRPSKQMYSQAPSQKPKYSFWIILPKNRKNRGQTDRMTNTKHLINSCFVLALTNKKYRSLTMVNWQWLCFSGDKNKRLPYKTNCHLSVQISSTNEHVRHATTITSHSLLT